MIERMKWKIPYVKCHKSLMMLESQEASLHHIVDVPKKIRKIEA